MDKKTKKLLALLGFMTMATVSAQTDKVASDSLTLIQTKTAEISKEPAVKVNFYGFIRHDAF